MFLSLRYGPSGRQGNESGYLKVRTWAITRGELFIFTGPVYEGGAKETIGKNRVAVPSALYKIVYDPNKEDSIAFFMPNKPLKTSEMPKYIVPVRDNELPRSKLRGIGGMGTIIMPPHPALSLKGRGNIVTPKQSFEESID